MTKFALHGGISQRILHALFSSNLICICLLVNILQLLYCSEEAQEGSNQDIKDFQLDHSRQMGFETRNLDTFHRLLDRQGDNSAWSQACAILEFLFGFK